MQKVLTVCQSFKSLSVCSWLKETSPLSAGWLREEADLHMLSCETAQWLRQVSDRNICSSLLESSHKISSCFSGTNAPDTLNTRQKCQNMFVCILNVYHSWVVLTAPWYISISLSPKYGICLKGLTEMSTGPMYVWWDYVLKIIKINQQKAKSYQITVTFWRERSNEAE